MNIQAVLTEANPIFEFEIPREKHGRVGTLSVLINGIADEIDAVDADPVAEPPIVGSDAVPANIVTFEYEIPAGIDGITGAFTSSVWTDSGLEFEIDGLYSINYVSHGKMRFVLSGERNMRISIHKVR
jgi:hypothetical protein